MKLHYKGKFICEASLPTREVDTGVPFKEPENMSQLARIASIISIALLVAAWGIAWIRAGFFPASVIGCLLSLVTLVPHEFLHALWFKEDVYLYQNLNQGMLFVIGTEDMSVARFVAMSLCPNVVFGFLPYLVFMIDPSHVILGMMGILAISMGAGDYINVYNAVTQVPKGGLVYLSGMHSYWYIKEQ